MDSVIKQAKSIFNALAALGLVSDDAVSTEVAGYIRWHCLEEGMSEEDAIEWSADVYFDMESSDQMAQKGY